MTWNLVKVRGDQYAVFGEWIAQERRSSEDLDETVSGLGLLAVLLKLNVFNG